MKGFPKLMNNNTINAVTPKDYSTFLESIGEIDRINAKQCKCYFCGETISLSNIYSVFPIENSVNYCCSHLKCVLMLAEKCNSQENKK